MSQEQPPIPPIVDLRRWREVRSKRSGRRGVPSSPPKKPARRPPSVPRKAPQTPWGGRYRMLLLLGGSFLLILGAILFSLLLVGVLGE